VRPTVQASAFQPGDHVRVTHSHRDTGTVLPETDPRVIAARQESPLKDPTIPVLFDAGCKLWSPGEMGLIWTSYLEAQA